MVYGTCAECGKQTQADCKSHLAMYCSNSCAGKAKWRKRKRAQMVTRTCKHCGQDFQLKESALRSREKRGDIVQYCSQKCSALAHQKRETVTCAHCNKEFEALSSRQRQFCSNECRQQHESINGRSSSKRTGAWMENGYRVIYAGDGEGIKEHIKVMEEHIGRKLRPDEVVHHINENRLDNRIENLQLMTRGEHSRLHRLQEKAEGRSFGRYFKGNKKSRSGQLTR